jgi:hypothetical protein
LAAGLSVLLKEKRKQIPAMIVIPVLGGLLVRPVLIELMVYIPIWGYIMFLLMTERLYISRGGFLDRVRKILFMCLLLPIFMLTEIRTFIDAVRAALPYIVTTLVSIIFMLRHLRNEQGREGQKGYYLQQVWEMVTFLVVSVLLAITRAPQNLMIGLQLIYNNIIQPVIALISSIITIIFGGIIYLILSLLSLAFDNRELVERKEEMGNQLNKIPEVAKVNVSYQEWILPLLYSLGVILGLIILFIFFRWLIGERNRQKLPNGISEIRELLEEPYNRKKNHRWNYSKQPGDRIRYYYSKYLFLLRSKSIPITSGDTTREVDQKYSVTLTDHYDEQREASKQLKRLYRQARYQKQKEMTIEEADQAKLLYQTIKSKNKNNLIS